MVLKIFVVFNELIPNSDFIRQSFVPYTYLYNLHLQCVYRI